MAQLSLPRRPIEESAASPDTHGPSLSGCRPTSDRPWLKPIATGGEISFEPLKLQFHFEIFWLCQLMRLAVLCNACTR